MTAEYVGIEPLDEGFVVSISEAGVLHPRRLAAGTRQEALTLAARALGYRGVIRFDDERTVEVPVVGMAAPEVGTRPDYTLPEGPILTQAYGLGPGPAVDDDEPPLRAGTVTGDKL